MQVSPEVKEAFKATSITKHIVVNFPNIVTVGGGGYTVPENEVYMDSMSLEEHLMDSKSIEFVGCVASKFKITIRDFGQDIKGQKIIAWIYPEGYSAQKIRLFTGIVDEAKLESNHKYKKIVAYDELYTKGNKDVSSWYKGLTFPCTLGHIRRTLFTYLNLSYTDKPLPTDGIKIAKKYYQPSQMVAIDIIKSICQINGVCGMMDRYGSFKFVVLPEINTIVTDGAYPGVTLYPPFYPGVEREPGIAEGLPVYKSLDYQEYSVKPVQRLTIRQDAESDGVTVGTGENRYIIQGNIFTYKMKNATLTKIANAILPNIQGVSFIPYDSTNPGFPWLECGEDAIDCVVYDFDNATASTDAYKDMQFYVLNRNLSGTQNLKDNYTAEGDEYQKEFVTDLGVNLSLKIGNIKKEIIDEVNENLEENYYDQGDIDQMFEDLPTGWSVESVPEGELPPVGQDQVLYLIQGEVVVD